MNPAFIPFILRFQEMCFGPQVMGASTGTTTITAVRAEEIDADPDKNHFGALPKQLANSGTTTATFTRAEGADKDPDARSLSAIPREAHPSLGTETMTRTRGEAADEDPGGRLLRAIPCSLS